MIGIEKGEEIQVIGTENILFQNQIIKENFPNLKEMPIKVKKKKKKHTEQQIDRTRIESHLAYNNQNSKWTEQRKEIKRCKTK